MTIEYYILADSRQQLSKKPNTVQDKQVRNNLFKTTAMWEETDSTLPKGKPEEFLSNGIN